MNEAPKATKQSIASLYNRVARQYDRVGPGIFTVLGDLLVEEAQLNAGMRVLDIGTGRGAILYPTRQAIQERGLAVGIDLAWEMVHQTSLEPHPDDPTAMLICMDGEQLGFAVASFDILLCGFAFFFIDPRLALPEWWRVLKPGGRLAISVAESTDPNWAWYEEHLLAFHKRHNLPLFSGQRGVGEINRPAEIVEELHSNKFRNVRIKIHELNFEYPDADTWWKAKWTHGARYPLEHIPSRLLDVFRQDVIARAEQTDLRESFRLACVLADR
ncbi:MAG: methyltransferase domain-containing protein [Chloroflexi bacterium]|nr:MAG: methyltransferase domain-containing protein [Chloroflexota bacterium]